MINNRTDAWKTDVNLLNNKKSYYRGGTTRGTDTAPEEYTGYPKGGSAAWIVRFLSSVGWAWILYLSSSSLVKYRSSSAREAHWPRTHSPLRRPTGAIISCFERTRLVYVPCEGKRKVAFNKVFFFFFFFHFKVLFYYCSQHHLQHWCNS